MKLHFSYLRAAAVVLVLGFPIVPRISARQRTDSARETFIGEVTRNPEIEYDSMDQMYRHVIYDEIRKTNYYLDDHGNAEKYDGKKVEIKGSLNHTNTTIHVDSFKVLN